MGIEAPLWQARFSEYLLLRGRSAATRETYRQALQGFLEFLEGCGLESLGQLRRDHLEEYRLELHGRRFRGKSLAPSYRNVLLAAAKSFVRFLVKHQYLRFDVSAEVELALVPRSLPRALLSEGEIRRLLETVDLSSALGVRDRTLLELLYSTALRNAEMVAVRVDDLDFPRRLLRVRQGKGGKSRVVPFGGEAEGWLRQYLDRARPVLARDARQLRLFVTWRGQALETDGVRRIVHQWAKAAGLPAALTPHGLRHACATHMLRRGAGLRELQDMLGHTSLTSTQIYTQVDVRDLRTALMRYHPRERPRP